MTTQSTKCATPRATPGQARYTAAESGMQWLLVREDRQIVGACYSLFEARRLAQLGRYMVKSAHTGATVYIAS